MPQKLRRLQGKTKIVKAERSGKEENKVFTPRRCRGASCFIQKQGKPSAAAKRKRKFLDETLPRRILFYPKTGKAERSGKTKTQVFG